MATYEITPKGKRVLAIFIGIIAVVSLLVHFRHSIAPSRPTTAAMSTSAFGTVNGDGGGTVAPAAPVAANDVGSAARPLKVAINIWPGYAGGLAANGGRLDASQESVFYRSHGILVQFILADDFAGSRDAFRTGQFDVLWGTVDAFAQEAPGMAALNPRSFMQFDYSRGGDAIAAVANIRTVNDLRGKRVAFAPGSPSHYLLAFALSRANLSFTDITPVNTATALEAATTFRTGRVDAAVSWDPDVVTAAASQPGGHILLSTATADHLIADHFVARAEFIAAHRDVLARFAAGWFEGVRMVARDPSVGARALAGCLPGITLADAPGMLRNAALSSYRDNRGFYGLDQGQVVTFASIFGQATSIWRDGGLITSVAQASRVVDTSVLAAIAAQEDAAEPAVATAPRVYATEADGGAPAAAVLTERLSLQFPTNSAAIDGNAEFAIRAIGNLASTFEGARMRVTGNTDSTGSEPANVILSRQRAEAIVSWLITHNHYDRSKFEIVGAGSSNPVCREATPECRGRNRRTDFEIIPEAGH